MKTLLKENIWIEGFNSYNETNRVDAINGHRHLYIGKTSDIPEEIAENIAYKGELCEYYWNEILDDYDKTITANESIQLALAKEDGRFYEYCIIYEK